MNDNIYALLVGVGNYAEMNIHNLPSYSMDLTLIKNALEKGLKCNPAHIRTMPEDDKNGIVNVNDFVREIRNFGQKLTEQDTFIFYFSGHGSIETLTFSNLQLNQQSVIDYISGIRCKNKIVFLDCCYSGNFEYFKAQHIDIDKTMEDYVGHGIAVYASSSDDELSRIADGENQSIFTGKLAASIMSEHLIRKGKIELNDIYRETQKLIWEWNEKNPDKIQNPVYRTSIGGTIYFPVSNYESYETKKYSEHNEKYDIIKVKPLSSSSEKRLAVFVALYEPATDGVLSVITQEIAEKIKYADIYSADISEKKFKNTAAKAIWCYFGNDESDIVNSTYQYYTIWAEEDVKKKYFRESSNSRIINEIYIFENGSYALVKKMQENDMPRERYIEKCKEYLKLFIDMVQDFLTDLQEVANKTLTYEKLQKKYGQWIKEVKKEFIALSDMEVAPDDLHDWVEEIFTMSGCVLDLSMIIEGSKETNSITTREEWMINHAIKQYYESIEKLKVFKNNN